MKLTMNKRYIFNITATALFVYGIAIIPSIFVAAYYTERVTLVSIALVSLFSISTGVLITKNIGAKPIKVKQRVNFFATIFTWAILIILTMVPFYFSNIRLSIVDSLYEASAAWTTTGSGVVNTATLPFALQFLRATCNWMGGIGIILISLSLIPNFENNGHDLAVTELPGSDFLKNTTHFKNTFLRIIIAYLILTFIQFALLLMCAMNPFEAFISSLSNISTSGLQNINNGNIMHLSTDLKVILTLFAFLGSLNFSIFILLFNRQYKELKNRSELRGYLLRILVSTAIIMFFLLSSNQAKTISAKLPEVLMQVISFFSTSGYIVTDCGSWPTFCIIIVILQMFIGSCAVSTGGGIKIARIIICIKTVKNSLFRHLHPRAVNPISFNGKTLTNAQIARANIFLVLFMLTYLGGGLIISIQGIDIYSALNWSQAMLNNTGTSIGELSSPGLAVGFTDFSKIIMSILMVAGRLEIYPVLMLFFRSFWISDNNI